MDNRGRRYNPQESAGSWKRREIGKRREGAAFPGVLTSRGVRLETRTVLVISLGLEYLARYLDPGSGKKEVSGRR